MKKARLDIMTLLLLLGILILAQPTLAQDHPPYDVVYYEGEFGFHYQQWPFGGYNGDFYANGPQLDDDGNFEPGETNAVGGFTYTDNDTTVVYCYGAILNPDTTVDLALCFVRTQGEFTPGTYPVDAVDFMGGFAFFDDIANFQLPVDFDPASLQQWLDDTIADHKFISTSGSITVNEASVDNLIGSFTGSALDAQTLMIISVTDGAFDLAGREPVDSVAELPLALHSLSAYPTPFNPLTTIHFDLATDEAVRLSIFDLAGRQIRQLHEGFLTAGAHGYNWNGLDRDRQRVGAGVYVYRLEGASWSSSGKVVLTP